MSRVLIADDEAPIREMIRIACEMDGHETRTVISAAEALEAYDAFRPDVLILDMNMPGGGGGHVIDELARRGETCPTLVVTGLGGAMDDREREDLGATQVLSKPFSIDSLRIAVKTVLGG